MDISVELFSYVGIVGNLNCYDLELDSKYYSFRFLISRDTLAKNKSIFNTSIHGYSINLHLDHNFLTIVDSANSNELKINLDGDMFKSGINYIVTQWLDSSQVNKSFLKLVEFINIAQELSR